MMQELRDAAKEALGLYAIWIDDEQYDLIINAVFAKVAEMAKEGRLPADEPIIGTKADEETR